jgi:hypothetical protein
MLLGHSFTPTPTTNIQQGKSTDILNRDQTEEWKGWMQFMFLMYHYYHAEEVYNAIRIMITCYVWMTGFGNFSFFYIKQVRCCALRCARVGGESCVEGRRGEERRGGRGRGASAVALLHVPSDHHIHRPAPAQLKAPRPIHKKPHRATQHNTKQDFGIVRFVQMLWRLNFLVVLLCLSQGTCVHACVRACMQCGCH